MNCIRQPDGTVIPAIPEPFWYRGWQTLFRWRPGCFGCRLILKTKDQWQEHWIKYHSVEEEDGVY